MKLELDLDKIKYLGKERLDENFDFRAFLKGEDTDKIDKNPAYPLREISLEDRKEMK